MTFRLLCFCWLFPTTEVASASETFLRLGEKVDSSKQRLGEIVRAIGLLKILEDNRAYGDLGPLGLLMNTAKGAQKHLDGLETQIGRIKHHELELNEMERQLDLRITEQKERGLRLSDERERLATHYTDRRATMKLSADNFDSLVSRYNSDIRDLTLERTAALRSARLEQMEAELRHQIETHLNAARKFKRNVEAVDSLLKSVDEDIKERQELNRCLEELENFAKLSKAICWLHSEVITSAYEGFLANQELHKIKAALKSFQGQM